MPLPLTPTITGPAMMYDLVMETSSTTGTGTMTLLGAVFGCQSFAVVGDGNPCYYTARDPSTGDYEVGIGTYTLSGTTLSRTTILASSNSGAAVSWVTGIRSVYVDLPANIALNALFTGTASVTVANTTSATSLLPSGVGINGIPAGLLIAGKTVGTKTSGYLSTHASAPGTLTLAFELGGSVFATTGAVTVPSGLTNAFWECEVDTVCYTAGSSGTVSVQGRLLVNSATQTAFLAGMVNTSTSAYNTSQARKADLVATWSSAQTDNSITLTNFSLVPVN